MVVSYRSIITTIVLVMCVRAVHAGSAGAASATFLKIGVGARNVAMGETGATASDIYATYWNPAGLARIEGSEITFMHAAWLVDQQFQNIAYARKTSAGTWGVAATYLSGNSIDKYDNTGQRRGGSYSPYDLAVTLSWAAALRESPVGLNLKYISSDIDGNTATALAADAGVFFNQWLFPGNDRVTAGLALQNMGTRLKYDQESFPLPWNIKAGAAYNPTQPVVLALDLNKPVDQDVTANVGGEYAWSLDSVTLAARAGFRSNIKGQEGLAGLTCGLGFTVNKLRIDYAYVPYGDLDDTHRISLTYGF